MTGSGDPTMSPWTKLPGLDWRLAQLWVELGVGFLFSGVTCSHFHFHREKLDLQVCLACQ